MLNLIDILTHDSVYFNMYSLTISTWNIGYLKLKTIHKCFLCPYKRQSWMICFIAFRFSRTLVKSRFRQSKCCRKAILHKLPIYNEYMCLCGVSTLFGMICCLFFNCSKSSTTHHRSLYTCITFYICCKL